MITTCYHEHEYTIAEIEKYADIMEHCDDCYEPVIYSCCNLEVTPDSPRCPDCQESCL